MKQSLKIRQGNDAQQFILLRAFFMNQSFNEGNLDQIFMPPNDFKFSRCESLTAFLL